MLDLIKQYGPVILAMIVAYWRDQINEERNKRRIAELDLKIERNHALVDAANVNKSDTQILDSIDSK